MQFCVYTERVKEATLNLAQVAGTYDAMTATGDVMIYLANVYCTLVGATFTSVAIQTNQAVPLVLLSSAEGAVANIVAGAHPTAACQSWTAAWTLRSGQKIQYTIVGSTGTGELKLFLKYSPISAGAYLT